MEERDARTRNQAGSFAYYVLALSWSPSYCAEKGSKRRDAQCTSARPYAFVLHGLWPQYATSWPEFCQSKKAPFVPESVLTAMRDIMPARRLMIHQFRKHGSCTGMSAENYFKTARRLYESIKIPTRYVNPRDFQTLSPQQIVADFVGANTSLSTDAVAVACGRGRRLRDVRICFSKDLNPQSCGANEDPARLCRISRVILPPVRQNPAR